MKTPSRKPAVSKAKKTAPPPETKKKAAPVRTANHEKAIRDYEDALKLFQKKDYAKAIHAFEAIIKEYPIEREVCDRARMRISFARGQGGTHAGKPKDSTEMYYLGVMAANDGRLDEAADLLEKASRSDGFGDRALYSLAAVSSLKGDRASAIAHLSRAISMNQANRTLALNDPDFDALREDGEFMSLLGKAPERGA